MATATEIAITGSVLRKILRENFMFDLFPRKSEKISRAVKSVRRIHQFSRNSAVRSVGVGDPKRTAWD